MLSHVTLGTNDIDRAVAFYDLALAPLGLARGATDEGAPGLRPHYHADYYGAYLRDPDGNKLCCVCHRPTG